MFSKFIYICIIYAFTYRICENLCSSCAYTLTSKSLQRQKLKFLLIIASNDREILLAIQSMGYFVTALRVNQPTSPVIQNHSAPLEVRMCVCLWLFQVTKLFRILLFQIFYATYYLLSSRKQAKNKVDCFQHTVLSRLFVVVGIM